jgi:hypothetical protein
MPSRHEFYFPDLDVVPPSEKLRRRLYDAAALVAFPQSSDDPEEHLPHFGPEETMFTVVWLAGRWFAYWRDLEADLGLPLCRQVQVVRIHSDINRPEGIYFSEV